MSYSRVNCKKTIIIMALNSSSRAFLTGSRGSGTTILRVHKIVMMIVARSVLPLTRVKVVVS
jgi:hypothetical protein